MKKLAIAVAAVLATGTSAVFAQTYYHTPQDPYYQARDQNRAWRGDRDRDGHRDFARVIDTRPIYASSGSGRQECWNPRAGVFEEVRPENRTRVGKGAAAGAVVGGVLGHQVDQGGGTAAGAVLGGLLGHHLERRNDRNEQDDLDFTRCRVAGDPGNNAVAGYEVRYEYEGREYVTRMNHDPGRLLRVGEDIRPDGTPLAMNAWR